MESSYRKDKRKKPKYSNSNSNNNIEEEETRTSHEKSREKIEIFIRHQTSIHFIYIINQMVLLRWFSFYIYYYWIQSTDIRALVKIDSLERICIHFEHVQYKSHSACVCVFVYVILIMFHRTEYLSLLGNHVLSILLLDAKEGEKIAHRAKKMNVSWTYRQFEWFKKQQQ